MGCLSGLCLLSRSGSFLAVAVAVIGLVGGRRASGDEPIADVPPLVMVVTDPLAAELSCPCVAGYAQRDYGALAEHLSALVGREVSVAYGESIARAVGDDVAAAHVVIGKRSVVVAEAARTKRPLQPVAELTGLDGSTTHRGLVVVHGDDAAEGVGDLGKHAIVLGPDDCEEKHAAARKLFSAHRIDPPATCEEAAGCTQAAERVLATRKAGGKPVAAVVSSYATPLLEGCGTIKKGDLRVIGQTDDVPFIAAFVDARVDADTRRKIVEALRAVADDPVVKLAIESKLGFRIIEQRADENADWPGWRGQNRDARVSWLPDRLPESLEVAWATPLFNEGVGGVAVAAGVVLVSDRDADDARDVFHALDALTGERLWTLDYAAEGSLDYGNSPRATPLVHDGHAFLLGAFGHLHCVRLSDGGVVWRRHVRDDFKAEDDLVWGVAASPLVVDGKLILNPGGPEASIVALEPTTGAVIWSAPGAAAAYASLVVAALDGKCQLVGYDAASCGGWDVATGKRLWSLAPKVAGDFNVPTPLVVGTKTVFVSEHNGARSVGMGGDGRPRVEAVFTRLDPDMHSPVYSAGRIFGVHKGRVTCLDAETLQPAWVVRDRSLQGHASLIASPDRVLIFTEEGELILIDAKAETLKILARTRVFTDDASTLAHPALAAGRLYIRGPGQLVCVNLR